MAKKKPKREIAVIDFETDPFRYGRVPVPFCVEFYCDEFTQVFWGEDCAEKLCEYMATLEKTYIVYAHNGGKFDFHFLHKYIDNPALVIKTRITECKLFHHTLRDSFSIIPVPMRDYEKMEFEYWKMERPVREQYKAQILEYLHSDCITLYKMVTAFIDKYGLQMTIGGTAIKEIRKFHPFHASGEKHDMAFRPYYYGGRVQVFKAGIIKGPIKLYDVNSMYPAAMRNMKHPINGRFDYSSRMPDSFDRPFFITFEGTNHNALPSNGENGELIFTQKEGLFKACSHEMKIALEHNLITIDKVHECLISTDCTTFEEFVDAHYFAKAKYKEEGDKINELLEKLLLNSGYGRMGINPRNFADWTIHRDFGNEDKLIDEGYCQEADFGDIELWSKPSDLSDDQFCDVAIAASITSGARSILLAGLQAAIDPLYCDTDSIMCRGFSGDVDKFRLGAWDLEKTSEIIAIGGKKLYAMYKSEDLKAFDCVEVSETSMLCSKCKVAFNNPREHFTHQKECKVKLSCKGGSLNLSEIVRICNGETIHYENAAPTFSLKREPTFVHRNFRQTGKGLETLETVE